MGKSIKRAELERYLSELLRSDEYEDYGPNGLQIEGAEDISKITFAVSATADSVARTCELDAQALIVHHGLFWKFHGPRPLTGAFAQRVLPLARQNINLFGYHLPLDGHPELGNAAALASKLGLRELAPFGLRGPVPTGIMGRFPAPLAASELKERLSKILDHTVLHACPPNEQRIASMGIITGGANSEWKLAALAGLDSYLTGEMSEHDWNEAREGGVHMFAGGHHATERFGIQFLMQHLEEKFGLECVFIDSENPA